MARVIFSYNQQNIEIQCQLEEIMKDIFQRFSLKAGVDVDKVCFLYSGIIINGELTFQEVKGSNVEPLDEMTVLVYPIEEPEPDQNSIIASDNIICPKCKEVARIYIQDGYINIIGCKNRHVTSDISLEQFEELQKIDLSQIICDECKIRNKYKAYDGKFYKCLSCDKNLCEICKSSKHNKNHKIVNYDRQYFICKEHNEKYTRYCNQCKNNICLLCEQQHKNHETENIMPDVELIEKEMIDIQEKIDLFNTNITKIIKELEYIMKSLTLYSNICNNIYLNTLKKYDNQDRNYELLCNLKELKDNIIVKYIDKANDNINTGDKINIISELYNLMTNNEINIIYNIDKNDNSIKLFGSVFVNNNINHCKIICEGKEYKLAEYFDISDKNNNKGILSNLWASKKNELIIKLQGINNITNMNSLFNGCSQLVSLPDIHRWNTSKVTNMSYLFAKCNSLKNFYGISNWDTRNVKYMHGMFSECESLKSLPDISNWDTSNVIIMGGMFTSFYSLTPLSADEITEYINKGEEYKIFNGGIFNKCKALLSLPDISKWNTSKVIYMDTMFNACSSLKYLPNISKWNTSNVTNMNGLFSGCTLLKSLPDISKWNTSKVSCMLSMFKGCSSLSKLPDISKWDVWNKENIHKEEMFDGCNKNIIDKNIWEKI